MQQLASRLQNKYTANCNPLRIHIILEAVKILNLNKKTKIYKNSTRGLYGLIKESTQKKRWLFKLAVPMQLPNYMLIG